MAGHSMKAAVISRPGGPEVLEVHEVARPAPVADQVLVRVMASALNRADLLQRQGRYPAPPGAPADIPGIEFAGEIVDAGPLAQMWRPGQRVFAISAGGAHAEYIVAQERTLAEIPQNLDWNEAGAIPEAFFTAHDALWIQAALRPSETVLIHAIGSGVGVAAVQLVRALEAVPFGTSRTKDKLDRARRLGLEDGVVLTDDLSPMVDAAKRWTGGKGIDVVLDLVGGAYVGASIEALAPHGRLMCVGTVAGGRAEIELKYVLGRRLNVRGTVFRTRPLEQKIAATRVFAAEVAPLFARGLVRPVIDTEFPLGEIQAAHRRLESNETFGKVVLRIGG